MQLAGQVPGCHNDVSRDAVRRVGGRPEQDRGVRTTPSWNRLPLSTRYRHQKRKDQGFPSSPNLNCGSKLRSSFLIATSKMAAGFPSVNEGMREMPRAQDHRTGWQEKRASLFDDALTTAAIILPW